MAIRDVTELWSGRTGVIGDDYNRQYARVFQVRTTDEKDGPITAGFAPGIPRMWDAYTNAGGTEVDLLSRVRRIDPDQDDADPKLWIVRVEYEPITSEVPSGAGSSGSSGGTGGGGSDPAKPGGGGAADRPELQPPKIRWTSADHTKVMRKGYDNEGRFTATVEAKRKVPVVNSAGQPFDPIPEYEDGYPILEISRIEASFDPLKARDYRYAVNDEPFLFAPPEHAQTLPIEAEQVWIGGFPYWQVGYRIRFNDESWQTEILDAGYMRADAAEPDDVTKVTAILDPDSRSPVSEPWPLDGHGMPLDRAAIAKALRDDPEAALVYLKFYPYQRRSFAPLNLIV